MIRHYAAGKAIPESEVEFIRAVRWHRHVTLCLESVSTLFCEMYLGPVNEVVPVVASSALFGLVKDEDDWNLGNLPLSMNSDVRAILRVYFTAIQTQCHERSLAVPNKARDVFGLAVQGRDALDESREARMLVAALQVGVEGQLAKIDALESHEWKLLNKNRRFWPALVMGTVEKELHEAQDVEGTKSVTDAKVELVTAKEGLNVLEGRSSNAWRNRGL